jgi:hypothetical protein
MTNQARRTKIPNEDGTFELPTVSAFAKTAWILPDGLQRPQAMPFNVNPRSVSIAFQNSKVLRDQFDWRTIMTWNATITIR